MSWLASPQEVTLRHLEMLLAAADPDQPNAVALVEGALTRLLEGLAARRRTLPVRSEREWIDMRSTLREYARRGEFLPRLIHRERPREKQLILLLDVSESFWPWAAWSTTVALAATRIIPGTTVWGFGSRLELLEHACQDASTFLTGIRPRTHASGLTLLDMPEMLAAIMHQVPSASRIDVWVVSDLLLPPGRAMDLNSALLARTRASLRPFRRIVVLDPTRWYQLHEGPSGQVVLTGKDLAAELNIPRWQVAESSTRVDLGERGARLIAERLADQPVLVAQRLTPWLRELGLPIIARTDSSTCLDRLFFEEPHE